MAVRAARGQPSVSSMISPDSRPWSRTATASVPSMSSSVSRRERSAMMAAAASKRSRSTMRSNAPSARTHMLRAIANARFLQLEGDPVVDVVADVLLVGQHLVDGAARPRPAQIGDEMPRSFSASAISRSDSRSLDEQLGRSSRRSRPRLAGPGTRTTRSVWMLFCSPRTSSPFGAPALVDEQAAQAVAGRLRPGGNPSSISRHWPAKTLADSSRLYSPAIARFTLLTIVETGLPSFSNCSAQ